MIRGSGVNTKIFTPGGEPLGIPIVMLASRMLWNKGVGEFVGAARILKQEGIEARFILVGECDSENPESIPGEQLNEWSKVGMIEWWGAKTSMHKILIQAHIICLPSYREGLPKVLLEAASCEKPIIATDVPGCREVVNNGESGFLVPVEDSISLSYAIKKLVIDSKKRKIMGKNGRKIVEKEFSEEIIVFQTFKLYQRVLNPVN